MEYIPVFFFGLSKIDQETDENGKIQKKFERTTDRVLLMVCLLFSARRCRYD